MDKLEVLSGSPLFDMLSKNAKNANLRIVGTLAAPMGEFQFF